MVLRRQYNGRSRREITRLKWISLSNSIKGFHNVKFASGGTFLSRYEGMLFLNFPRTLCLLTLLIMARWNGQISAQTRSETPYYARVNTLGIFGAYSADSSHILLGYAENRELLDFGISYNRRLFLNNVVNWQYSGELLPVALESDPMSLETVHSTSPTVGTILIGSQDPMVTCTPLVLNYSFTNSGTTYTGTDTFSCSGRRWTMGEAMSPIGFQWNFLPLHSAQPFFVGHGGYMYSTRQIPVDNAGSFNFTFDLGAGVELYHGKTRSVRVEYRYHHISNHNTAQINPGIDNGLFQVTYCFRLGRK
jgi:Lipid A 3-O-deacylase (PagL)